MKAVTFILNDPWYAGYKCSEPGNHDGEYVRAQTAMALLHAVKLLVKSISDGDYAVPCPTRDWDAILQLIVGLESDSSAG